MTLSAVVRGNVTQHFGRPALKAEPTAWLAPDESKAKFQAFPGAHKYDDVHMGVDVACPVGTAVRAPADGRIVRCNTYRVWNPFTSSYVLARDGWFVYGKRMLYVAHLSSFPFKEGTARLKGQVIFRTGMSGVATGPHAHLEVLQTTNPFAYGTAMRLNPERVL